MIKEVDDLLIFTPWDSLLYEQRFEMQSNIVYEGQKINIKPHLILSNTKNYPLINEKKNILVKKNLKSFKKSSSNIERAVLHQLKKNFDVKELILPKKVKNQEQKQNLTKTQKLKKSLERKVLDCFLNKNYNHSQQDLKQQKTKLLLKPKMWAKNEYGKHLSFSTTSYELDISKFNIKKQQNNLKKQSYCRHKRRYNSLGDIQKYCSLKQTKNIKDDFVNRNKLNIIKNKLLTKTLYSSLASIKDIGFKLPKIEFSDSLSSNKINI